MTPAIQKFAIVVTGGVGIGSIDFGPSGMELTVFSIRTASATPQTVSLFGYDLDNDPAFGVDGANLKLDAPYYSGLVNTPVKGRHAVKMTGDDGTYFIVTRSLAS